MKISKNEIGRDALDNDSLADAARTFRESGYVVLEGIYDPDWIAALRTSYDALLAEYLEDKGGIEAMAGKTFGTNHVGIHPPLVMPWADPQIVAHPITDQVLSTLLGEDYHCGFYHTNTAYPGSGIQPIHRDDSLLFSSSEMNVPHPVVSIVLNIPLCDFTEENGSTEIWPGSHLIVDRTPEDRKELEARAATLASSRTNIKAGSLILRDLRMFHRGMPNVSQSPRTMLAIVYVRAWRLQGRLKIPQATWDTWPERTRQIYRHNSVFSSGDEVKQNTR